MVRKPTLQGRLGAARVVRRGGADQDIGCTFVLEYAPLRTAGVDDDKQAELVREALANLLERIPRRSALFLFLDANGHVGKDTESDALQHHGEDEDVVGAEEPENLDDKGR